MRINIEDSAVHSALCGAVSGFAATGPMTVLMLAVHRLLPRWQQEALPPEEITDWMLQRLGVRGGLSKPQLVGVALVSHFGFGSTAGAVHGALMRKRGGRLVGGVAYGLVVYAVNYMGWIPAAGVLKPPHKAPKGRVAMMVLAHVVYGAALSTVSGLIGNAARKSGTGAPTPL